MVWRRKALSSRLLLLLLLVLEALSSPTIVVNAFVTPVTRNICPSSVVSSRRSSSLFAMSTPTSPGLFLFDFDGVVCDSCDECTVSALRTCRKLGVLDKRWNDLTDPPPTWLLSTMRELRPVIYVGWQIPVLLAVVLEQTVPDGDGKYTAKLSVPEIMKQYETLVNEWLNKWNLTEKDMIQAFGDVRDAWMAEDLNSWLDINRFYAGVRQAFSNCPGETVLVTTKQHRFATALCRHAGVDSEALPDKDIYGLGMYKKKNDVIVDRMKAGGYSPQDTRFFEDRWPTLAKCLQDDRLDGVQLFLASWGYVTEQELELAKAEPRVQVLELDQLASIVSSS